MREVLIAMAVLNVMLAPSLWAEDHRPIKMLFYGNSFTGMHNIPLLVKQLSENGQPDVDIDYMRALGGGKTIQYHWETCGNQIYLTLPERSAAELEAELAGFEKAFAEEKRNKKEQGTQEGKKGSPYLQRIANYEKWLGWMKESGVTPKLDYVVLQVHKDEKEELASPYAVYARKFAKEAKKHGVKPILYLTEFYALNAKPLTEPIDPKPFMEKARYQAALANELDALTVPVPLAVLKLLQKRPDLTLRYSDNAHLNQVCAYVTACCFYATMFDSSPVGLTMREINNPGFENMKDPDGNPKNVVFPESLATALQEAAWEAVSEMNALRRQLAKEEPQ